MSEPPWYAQRFDADYLEAYGHRDRAEAERAVGALFAPHGLDGRVVLDLGCGAGRYTLALAARGARVVGLDLSAALLAAARAAGAGELVRADMRRLPFVAATFDLVASMFTSFGYFATADEDREVLVEVARVLRPGGELVLDTLNAAVLRQRLPPQTERRAGGWTIRERRRVDGGCIVKHITMRRGAERRETVERVRMWERPDLEAALAAAGLGVVVAAGDYDATPFDAATSPRLVLRARRTA
jgi:SAM-dependent methyltransferase